jgi:hypothetical protein
VGIILSVVSASAYIRLLVSVGNHPPD